MSRARHISFAQPGVCPVDGSPAALDGPVDSAPFALSIPRALRRDPAIIRLALAWRDLTGGRARGRDFCRRTVLACSGGGDSCGLVAGLVAAVPGARGIFVIAHILHDMRPPEQAEADRDAAASLAQSLGLPFAEASIRVRTASGNPEAAARRLRYRALAHLAEQHGCRFIATAHHAQDQFETLLMALLRGAGPRGLRGIASTRKLPGTGIRLIRPALDLDTADLRRLCEIAGIAWREDLTNLDTTRLRAGLRHGILPQLEELRPGAAARVARAARLIAASEAVLADLIRALLEQGRHVDRFTWDRRSLRNERGIVIGGALRAAAAELRAGRGQDRLGSRRLAPIIRAIKDTSTQPRHFEIAGLALKVTARAVELAGMEG